MAIFYDDGNAKGGSFNPSAMRAMNPNSAWANHSYNHFVLTHISRSSPDPREKMQAIKELDIAERKMKFWERQAGFDETAATHLRKKYYRF